MASTPNQGPGPTITHVHPAYHRNPLEIPELLTLIGQHMDNRTLCTSIRVSHLWNSSFLPFLWSIMHVHGLSRVEYDALKANAKYICDLRLMDDVDLRYGTDLFCPNLTHLAIDCFLVIENYLATPLYAFSDLIRRHRHTLKSIRFAPPTDEALWTALEDCTQLEDLTILELKLTYPGEWLSLYDRIWSRLTVLHIAGDWTPIEIPEDLLLQPTKDSRALAKIEDLTIARDNFVPDERQRYHQTQAQGWIVQQCQSLVQCDWKTGGYDQGNGTGAPAIQGVTDFRTDALAAPGVPLAGTRISDQ